MTATRRPAPTPAPTPVRAPEPPGAAGAPPAFGVPPASPVPPPPAPAPTSAPDPASARGHASAAAAGSVQALASAQCRPAVQTPAPAAPRGRVPASARAAEPEAAPATTRAEPRAPEPPPPGARCRSRAASGPACVRVGHAGLLGFVGDVLEARDVPRPVARAAAEALCYGDLAGFPSHGVANLTRLYLPLLDRGRCDPRARPRITTDRGASVLLDARRALGLWAAGHAMDLAVERAREHGIGMVSVRGGTHFGCAGHHALRATRHGMIGLVTANCGAQRLVPPVGGAEPMLGTNPLSLAAPAGPLPPFVLDMSTTVVPTGKVRAAARDGAPVPPGWLEDERGGAVTDPAEFDRGRARLRWLGGEPLTGAHKGFGLGLLVEVLSALVPGAGTGPGGAAGGRARREDDDIGYLTLAIAPGRLRPEADFLAQSGDVFGALLGCPPLRPGEPVGYPGVPEARRTAERLRTGVPLAAAVHRDLLRVADEHGLTFPEPLREDR